MNINILIIYAKNNLFVFCILCIGEKVNYRMQVQNVTSFISRNYEIRRADDIAREVIKKYPMVSSSKLGSLPKAEKFEDVVTRLHHKLCYTRVSINDKLNSSNFNLTSKERILSFLRIIKNDRLGNCCEMVKLAMIRAFLNGITDTYIAGIRNSLFEIVDHNVLFVNDEKPYIIDPWLSFADYLPNAIQRYKSDFSEIFHFEDFAG